MIARAAAPVIENIEVNECERFLVAAAVDGLDDAVRAENLIHAG